MRVERLLSDRRTLIGAYRGDAPRYRYIKSDTRATDVREQVYGSVHLSYNPGTICVPGRLIEPRFVRARLVWARGKEILEDNP